MEEHLPKAGTILKSLNGMLRVKNSIALYKDFYKQMNIPEMFLMPEKDFGMGGCISVFVSSCGI